jgi:fluoroacetyl-CoA thioesterase
MPLVYPTPMMISHMETGSGSAIAVHLLDGFVSRHDERVRGLAATPVRRTVHAAARVAKTTPRAWCSS